VTRVGEVGKGGNMGKANRAEASTRSSLPHKSLQSGFHVWPAPARGVRPGRHWLNSMRSNRSAKKKLEHSVDGATD